jgi:hypothetical protein
MHEIAAFLATLMDIAGEPCSCEERSSRAVAVVNRYSAVLYERLGIIGSNRPTRDAKSAADQTLADLRRQILAVEARSGEPSRTAFTAARHRIEMARRILASRLVDGAESPIVSFGRTVTEQRPYASNPAREQDWQILAALRRSVAQHEHVARSRVAIADSLRLLAACAAECSAPFTC